MSSDRHASELLSKSLYGELTADEQLDLDQNLSDSQESEAFARLSRMIQDSVTEVVNATNSGDEEIEPGLSSEAKSRLLNTVRKAKVDSIAKQVAATMASNSPLAGDGRIAETRFTMIREIGQGGLGSVWLARDEYLKRTVAVKELLSDKADSPKHLQRFQREAMITGLLEHPNVVPLYMYGINAETNKPFYAMRFLGKQTLHDAIEIYHARRQSGHIESIDLYRLLTVFLDVCQAIAYAHSRGVIHRDLKPDNVALDNFGQVIVLDWGIAKLLSEGELAIQSALNPLDGADAILTRTVDGEVIGTPLFMAPEQALGNHDHVDERTDVFGLGAILYAILTGKAPHQESTIQTSPSERLKDVLRLIADADIPKPSTVDRQVSRDLESICMRALSRHRYARHATAKELADDVERWIAGQHEKRKLFETMRLDGNGIRVGLESWIRDFGSNARFVSTLPPILGLIDAMAGADSEGEAVWRERLTTIFQGLLRSNPDFQAITYCQVLDDRSQELVRVEKLVAESPARSVPRSRLASTPLSSFETRVIQNKPDDVRVAIDRVTSHDACVSTLLLRAGVPIFDREEEPFGFVTVEGDFERLLEKQTENPKHALAAGVLVVDCDDKVLVDGDNQDNVGSLATQVISDWEDIKQTLSREADFQDRSGEVYATRVVLCPRAARSLKLVLIAK